MQRNKILVACLFIVILMISMVVARPPWERQKQCADGLDNDGDGYMDLMDPECFSELDNDESVGYSDCSHKNPRVVQKCCENWADNNGIFIPLCIGEWEVIDGECSFFCI